MRDELRPEQRDAILLVLLKKIRPKLSAAELNAIRFPTDKMQGELTRILSEQFEERERKKKPAQSSEGSD